MQLGQLMDNNKIQVKTKNLNATYEETEQNRCWEQKQGTAHSPCTQHHHPANPLAPTPGITLALISRKESDLLPASGAREPVVCFYIPLYCSMSPNKALPEFLSAFSQFLLIEEGQELWVGTHADFLPFTSSEQFSKVIPEPIPGPQSSVRHWIISAHSSYVGLNAFFPKSTQVNRTILSLFLI